MKPFVRRGAAVVAAAALVLGAAACGGDDSGGDQTTAATTAATAPVTTAPAALTADEFRRQANAVCAEYIARLDAIPEPASPVDAGPFFSAAVPVYQEFAGRLRSVVPPPELKADFDAGLALQGQLLGLLQQAQSRIAGGEDPTAVATEFSAQAEAVSDQLDQRAVALGIPECASDDAGTTTTDTTATTPTVTTAPDTTATAPTAGSTVDSATFVADVQAFGQVLLRFGQTLQAAAQGPDALRANTGQLRQQLDEYDAVVSRMEGYRLAEPSLERRRAAIVAASPDVSRLGRDLIDAAEANDGARVQSIATEFVAALGRLRSALNTA